MTDKNFHRLFAERFRGPKELIRKRLRFYSSFINPFLDLNEHPSAVDLGCGRGEWLEILSETGFDVIGFDKNPALLEEADEIKAKITCEDALTSLSNLADNSCHIVSAFHFVEHISFEELQKVVEDAFRILRPGGLIIIETPNPENILVSSKDFYRDPSHVKPIPPELLSFVVEQAGFSRNKIIRLQEVKQHSGEKRLTIRDVLGGPSPDYAVVGQKRAPDEILQRFDEPFSKNYGVSLEQVVTSFDSRFNDRLGQLDLHEKLLNQTQKDILQLRQQLAPHQDKLTLLEKKLESEQQERLDAYEKVERLSRRNGELEVKLANEKKVLETLRSTLTGNNRQLERLKSDSETLEKEYREAAKIRDELVKQKEHWRGEAKRFQHMFEETRNSRSWRVTGPLRKISTILRARVKSEPGELDSDPAKNSDQKPVQGGPEGVPLSPSARRIYQELRLAIDKKRPRRNDEDSN